eukprot:scaffold57703_cov39-Tisochrysis_lutea.AAC.2
MVRRYDVWIQFKREGGRMIAICPQHRETHDVLTSHPIFTCGSAIPPFYHNHDVMASLDVARRSHAIQKSGMTWEITTELSSTNQG